jgi:hypothetical protein
MKRMRPKSTFLEQLYRKRPDLEALYNAGDEAVMRRIQELEAMQKSGDQGSDVDGEEKSVDKPE